ncbi:MAG TPA: hypothetical protein VFL57_08700 [Bryobacteraceae bacterium]|nr:hypothetical protein [Bryobacteraceae bacterium]
MSWNSRRSVSVILILASAVPAAAAGLDDWIQDKVRARLDKKKPVQSETISLSRGSTTFVDQSAGADLISTAFSLVPVGRSGEASAGAGSVTASFYALYASATAQDPLRPSVYTRGAELRKFFVTLGREDKKATAAGDSSTQGTIVGFKWLPVNRREATSMAKDARLRTRIDRVLGNITTAMARGVQSLTAFLFEALGSRLGITSVAEFVTTHLNTGPDIEATLRMLTPAERANFDRLVNTLVERQVETNNDLPGLVQELQRRAQLAIDFQTTQRSGAKATDIYRGQLVFDIGLASGLFATLNGGYQYADTKLIGGDARGARLAGELRRDLASAGVLDMRSPMSLSLAAEGVREKSDWVYRAQIRFVLPLAPGVNLPISVGYGNRSEILARQEAQVFGKFGLTFDVSKLLEALRSGL